jgi:uncharacterized conserved protein, contains S4-like domain
MNLKERQFLINRISDLADRAYFKNIITHTVFLNLYEQTIFQSISASLQVSHKMLGGYDYAERKIVCFFSCDFEEIEDSEFVDLLHISNINTKFADKLSHRDYLGAIMNIGIERHMVGDICIFDDQAYVYVLKAVSNIITDSLTDVKHNKVTVTKTDFKSIDFNNNIKEKNINIASNRLDSIVSSVYNISRTKANILIDSDKVFINSKLINTHSKSLNTDDIVSVRGLGRFIYSDIEKTSKKGRLIVKIKQYE